MLRYFTVALALALCARGAVAADAPTPDCSVFSLEGVRLRMTLDEARAATPEWKWIDRKDGKGAGGDRWMATHGGGLKDTRLDVWLGQTAASAIESAFANVPSLNGGRA